MLSRGHGGHEVWAHIGASRTSRNDDRYRDQLESFLQFEAVRLDGQGLSFQSQITADVSCDGQKPPAQSAGHPRPGDDSCREGLVNRPVLIRASPPVLVKQTPAAQQSFQPLPETPLDGGGSLTTSSFSSSIDVSSFIPDSVIQTHLPAPSKGVSCPIIETSPSSPLGKRKRMSDTDSSTEYPLPKPRAFVHHLTRVIATAQGSPKQQHKSQPHASQSTQEAYKTAIQDLAADVISQPEPAVPKPTLQEQQINQVADVASSSLPARVTPVQKPTLATSTRDKREVEVSYGKWPEGGNWFISSQKREKGLGVFSSHITETLEKATKNVLNGTDITSLPQWCVRREPSRDDRGCWVFRIPSLGPGAWSSSERDQFWEYLSNQVKSGDLGSVSVEQLNAEVIEHKSFGYGNDEVAWPGAAATDDWVRLFCCGQVAAEAWCVLHLASDRAVLKLPGGMRWVTGVADCLIDVLPSGQ